MHRRIDGDDRRTFGGAIAFQNAQAEFLHPDFPRLLLDALGARHDEADVEEVVRMGVPRIAHQERVGAEQHRGIGVVAKLGHHLVVERRRIEEGADTRQNGQQRAGGKPERMEHGQSVEDDVGGREGDAGCCLKTVGVKVAVRQHHALRHALGTGGE